MTLLPLIFAAGMSQTASAKDVGIRLKVNSDLFNVASTQAVNADGDIDDADTKATTMAFFGTAPRLEATYIINPNIEAGLILGASDVNSEEAGDFDSHESSRSIGITGAYNLKLGDGLRGYVQPVVMTGRSTDKDEDGEPTDYINTLQYGLNLGMRIKLIKGATFDPAFEYLAGNAKEFDEDGEQVPNEDSMLKTGSYGLKAGLSIKF